MLLVQLLMWVEGEQKIGAQQHFCFWRKFPQISAFVAQVLKLVSKSSCAFHSQVLFKLLLLCWVLCRVIQCASSLKQRLGFPWPLWLSRSSVLLTFKASIVVTYLASAGPQGWAFLVWALILLLLMLVMSLLIVGSHAGGLAPRCVSAPPTLFNVDFSLGL